MKTASLAAVQRLLASPLMVDYLRASMPELSVHQADFRNLEIFAAGSFDFVIASDNVIDALAPEDRMKALAETRRVLRPHGYVAPSSHNLRYRHAFSGPRIDWSPNPVRMAANCAKYLLETWNHLRVAPLRRNRGRHGSQRRRPLLRLPVLLRRASQVCAHNWNPPACA